MTDEAYEIKKRQQFIWMKDKAGNEFACPVEALKKASELMEDEKKSCIDDASVHQATAGG